MVKLVICKGIPGSGKSTWARSMVDSDPTWKRVNRDDLRAILGYGDGKFDPKVEKIVVKTEEFLVQSLTEKGYNVIVDDTNVNPKTLETWKTFGKNLGLDVEEKLFDTPLEECIKRNNLRTGKAKVPEFVIKQMWEKLHGSSN